MILPKQECKISRDISKKILCLPIYAELEKEKQNLINRYNKEKSRK